MPEATMPSVREDFRFGMNSYDSLKILPPNVHQSIVNGYPGITLKPLNGVKDRWVSEVALGEGTQHSLFMAPGVHMIGEDDADYFFVFHRGVTDDEEYALEMWNDSDGARSSVIAGNYGRNDVYFSINKLYKSLYITMNHAIETNNNSDYLYQLKNKILEWDTDESTWIPREMNIDVDATFAEIVVSDTAASPWGVRGSHYSVAFNNKLWIIGGWDGTDYYSDIYSSTNGSNWVKEGDLPFVAAHGAVLVYGGSMWILGGYIDGVATTNEVWSSVDGITWVQVTDDAGWCDRTGHAAFVFNNKMWVVGGTGLPGTPDSWYSTDGVTWIQVTSNTGWSERIRMTGLTYNNKMYIIGGTASGTFYDDVYSSSDGATWSLETGAAAFGTRALHASVVFRGKMWVFGGARAPSYTELNDVYSSSDGATWVQETGAASWGARYGHQCVVFDNKIILTGGTNDDATPDTYYNDSYLTSNGVLWGENYGGLTDDKYYSCACTYVRRTDSNSVLSAIADYNYTTWETLQGRTVPSIDERMLAGTHVLSGNASGNLVGTGVDYTVAGILGSYIRLDGAVKSYRLSEIVDATHATLENPNTDSYTDKEASVLPTVGEPITVNTFLPGVVENIEIIENRRILLVLVVSTDRARLLVSISDVTSAVNQGATHLRYFRTLGHSTRETAEGLPHRFVVDIAIKGTSFTQDKIYRDSASDDELRGETNYLWTTGYSIPPLGRYSIWAGEGLWIGGVPDNDGHWYYSVRRGTTGVPFDTEFPQKFASIFNLNGDYKTCSPADGQKDTGCAILNGDLFLFKQRKIFMIYNSNPANDPVEASTSIGCAFPNSIQNADIPILGGNVILFVSERGPAYMLPGGKVNLLNEFRVTELMSRGLIHKRFKSANKADTTDWYSHNKVTSSFWQNTWWLMFGDERDADCQLNEDVSGASSWKCFGFHFGGDGTSVGPFERAFAPHIVSEVEYNIYQPQVLIPVDDNRAYTFSHAEDAASDTHYRLTRFQDPTVYFDTYDEVTLDTSYYGYKTRAYFMDPTEILNRGVQAVVIFIDTGSIERLTVVLTSDTARMLASCTLVQNRQSGMLADGVPSPDAYRGFVIIGTKDNFRSAHYVDIEVTKVVDGPGSDVMYGDLVYVHELDEREWEFSDFFDDATGLTTFVIEADDDPEEDAHD